MSSMTNRTRSLRSLAWIFGATSGCSVQGGTREVTAEPAPTVESAAVVSPAPEAPRDVAPKDVAPPMDVASGADTRGALPRGPAPTVEALCGTYDRAVAPLVHQAFPGDRYPGTIDGPHCKPARTLERDEQVALPADVPFRSARWLALHEPERGFFRLALESSAGFSITEVTLSSWEHDDPGCGHASDAFVEDARRMVTEGGRSVLVLRILQADVYWLGSRGESGVVERAYACDVDGSARAVCQGPVVLGKSSGWPQGWDLASNAFPRLRPEAIAWSSRHEAVLGPGGDLRVAP